MQNKLHIHYILILYLIMFIAVTEYYILSRVYNSIIIRYTYDTQDINLIS